MDSLLATYASDSDEDERKEDDLLRKPSISEPKPEAESGRPISVSKPSLSFALPPPKDANPTLPKPSFSFQKDGDEDEAAELSAPSLSSANSNPSMFSSIPAPKSTTGAAISTLSMSLPAPKNSKKVVEFRPPVSIASLQADDDEEEEDNRPSKKKKSSESESAKPSLGGLGAILPPPRNTALGSGAALGSGTGNRRNILDTTEDSSSNSLSSVPAAIPSPAPVSETLTGYESNYAALPEQTSYENYNSADCNYSSTYCPDFEGAYNASSDTTLSHEDYNSQQYSHAWPSQEQASYVSPTATVEPVSGFVVTDRKKGKNHVPENIVEVKQEDLVRNRPREDQAKLTGIAFGPAYKPVSATKDKPSKLHKRKHQIGALYYDLKQKEMELQERRARGQLTKAETQARYGW